MADPQHITACVATVAKFLDQRSNDAVFNFFTENENTFAMFLNDVKVSALVFFFLFFVQTNFVNFDADLRKDEKQQVHLKSANLRKEAVLVSVADLKHHSDTDTADAAAHEKDAVTGWE